MDEVFCRYGFPTEIVTNQGTQWMSASFKSFCRRLGIAHRTTSPYHPQSDMVERFNRTLLNMIRAYLEENKQEWDQHLQSLAFAYRTTVCETTQATPFELVQCRRARLPIDVLHSSFRSPSSSELMSRLTCVRRPGGHQRERQRRVPRHTTRRNMSNCVRFGLVIECFGNVCESSGSVIEAAAYLERPV